MTVYNPREDQIRRLIEDSIEDRKAKRNNNHNSNFFTCMDSGDDLRLMTIGKTSAEQLMRGEGSASAFAFKDDPWMRAAYPTRYEETRKYLPPPLADEHSIRTCDYDSDAPFLCVPSDTTIVLCSAALEKFNIEQYANYKYVAVLKSYITKGGCHASSPVHGSSPVYQLIFTASDSDQNDEKFNAEVIVHWHLPACPTFVQSVSLGRGILSRECPVGYYPRKCCYDFDPSESYYGWEGCVPFKELVRMSNLATQHINSTSVDGTKYVYVALLKAYYWKSGVDRYFHVRFKASLPHNGGVNTELEAQIYFGDQPLNGPWRESGGSVQVVSCGHGSLFMD